MAHVTPAAPLPWLAPLLPWLAGALWLLTCTAGLALLAGVRGAVGALDRGARRAWLLGVGVAALVRIAVPFDLVRVFTGWDLLGRAFPGEPLPRYGAGFVAALRPLLLVWPDPELWIAGLNALLGSATVAALSLMAGRWGQARRAHGAVTAACVWALALLPVLVRHHRSESALPLAFAAWLVGVAAWARWLRGDARRWAWLAMPALAVAAHTRPAFVFAGPVAVFALGRWLPGAARGRRWPTGPLALLLWLLVPQLLWLALGGSQRAGQGDLPAVASPGFLIRLPVMLVGMNLALWPHAFPAGLTVLGLRAAWRGRADPQVRGLLASLGAVGLALLVAGMADPVVVSLPRLQAPWLAIWTCGALLLAAPAAGEPWRPPRWLVALIAVTALATVPWLFRPENADHERRGLARAAAALAGQQGALYWLAPGDQGGDKVSRAAPAWRFRRPHARLRVAPLHTLRRATAEPRWVWLGVRCAAKHRAPDEPAPQDFEQPACAAVRARGDLEPVFEERVPNHGDVHFPWWPASPTLRIGLYRLRASRVDPRIP